MVMSKQPIAKKLEIAVKDPALRNSIIVALIVGTMGLVNSWMVSRKITVYTLNVDSKMDAFLKLQHKEGYDQGSIEATKQERNYQNDQNRKDDAALTRGPIGPEGPIGPRGPKGNKK